MAQTSIQSLEKIDNVYSIESFFSEIDNLSQSKEDTAFNFIHLAKSYKSRGLYSQSAENFSRALDFDQSLLDFNYYYNLVYLVLFRYNIFIAETNS